MVINQPSNQIKLTNLAIVRMKKGKKRFEVACYKNKILDFRNEIETDINNVIQTDKIYVNVNKGEAAKEADIEKAWPGEKKMRILEDIVLNGDSQVGEKERNAELERTRNEVIDIVASKLVDPKSKRVYTTGMIEKALDQLSSQAATQQQTRAAAQKDNKNTPAEASEEAEKPKDPALRWAGVRAGNAKAQSLHAIKCLIAHQPIPVMRVQMKLRITCPTAILKHTVKNAPKASQPKNAKNEEKGPNNVKDAILSYIATVQSQETLGAEWEAVGLVEPGSYKTLNEFIEGHTKGRGNVEVLDMAVGTDD